MSIPWLSQEGSNQLPAMDRVMSWEVDTQVLGPSLYNTVPVKYRRERGRESWGGLAARFHAWQLYFPSFPVNFFWVLQHGKCFNSSAISEPCFVVLGLNSSAMGMGIQKAIRIIDEGKESSAQMWAAWQLGNLGISTKRNVIKAPATD